MIVEAISAGVAYGGRTVLSGVDVTVEPGEQWALTGRSGSGKTTLLLMLAGLLVPSTGVVQLGLDRHEIVYVPQAPSLIPELTALQNASLGLRVRGVPPAEALDRAQRQLRALGLDDADDSLPDELSGGMQQRVALARALAVEPRLLLADEPTGALDSSTGQRVLDALRSEVARTSAALVVATHDPALAALFERQLVLDQELVR
ncbi:MAG: putative transport system ATP-binding protein [Frankiales bacterium]|jgi:putative ABC transport system ATP-binding protein|nr:putative transport system ATP-binding protein [Frankiales bacterium]